MNPESLPFNWYDLVVAAALIAGAILGRKKGLSEELLPVFQWLSVVVVGALYYEPIGRFLASYAQTTLLTANIVTYVGIILFHLLLFGWFKRLVGDKLVSSDVFGNLEYPSGAVAGLLKAACVVVVFMALLNSRYVSPETRDMESQMQRENFGSISFPTFGRLQEAVFVESVTGRMVGRYLNEQLIKSIPPGRRVIYRQSIVERRENAVEEILKSP